MDAHWRFFLGGRNNTIILLFNKLLTYFLQTFLAINHKSITILNNLSIDGLEELFSEGYSIATLPFSHVSWVCTCVCALRSRFQIIFAKFAKNSHRTSAWDAWTLITLRHVLISRFPANLFSTFKPKNWLKLAMECEMVCEICLWLIAYSVQIVRGIKMIYYLLA